jgi:hypothetical protein
MVLKVAFRPDPRALTTPTIATEIPATIGPYSIALAPDSSRRNSARGAPLAGGCTRPTPPPVPANRFRKETIVGNRFWGSLSHSPKGHDWRYVGPRPLGWGALGGEIGGRAQ